MLEFFDGEETRLVVLANDKLVGVNVDVRDVVFVLEGVAGVIVLSAKEKIC